MSKRKHDLLSDSKSYAPLLSLPSLPQKEASSTRATVSDLVLLELPSDLKASELTAGAGGGFLGGSGGEQAVLVTDSGRSYKVSKVETSDSLLVVAPYAPGGPPDAVTCVPVPQYYLDVSRKRTLPYKRFLKLWAMRLALTDRRMTIVQVGQP